jgi:hypothetical protein
MHASNLAILSSLLLAAAAGDAARPGPGALIELHERIFRALDGMDADALRSELLLDERFVLYAQGPAGPQRAQGEGQVWAWFQERIESRRAAGGRFRTRITWSHAECSSPDLGAAVLECVQTHEKDGATGEATFRLTALATWQDGRFRLRHWHLSPH